MQLGSVKLGPFRSGYEHSDPMASKRLSRQHTANQLMSGECQTVGVGAGRVPCGGGGAGGRPRRDLDFLRIQMGLN